MQNYFRKIYITLLLILILPPILLRLGITYGHIVISQDLAICLTLISKIGLITITIWYGLNVRINKFLVWILGFATLLPLMVWISAIILLTRNLRNKPEQLNPVESSLSLSSDHPFDENGTSEFVMWFIDNDPFVKTITDQSSNIIFEDGCMPSILVGRNPSKKFCNLIDWFIEKLTQDIEALRNASQMDFEDFLRQIDQESNKIFITSGKIAYKYNLDFKEFVYDKEIQKIPTGKERNLFKKNLLDDSVLGAESRILGWLYHEWFGDWYKENLIQG